MAAVYPSGSNTYIPSHEATGNLVVDFSRNPKKFALPRWAQMVPVTLNQGQYLLLTVEQAGRILNSGGEDFNWADGMRAPRGDGNTESFNWQPYLTKRKAYPYNIGYLASGQASWDILAWHARIYAQLAMTMRTQLAVTAAQTAANYDASHTADVSAITGVTGKWDVSTTARGDIKRSIDTALDKIRLDTLATVEPGDANLVMSPGCARKMASSQEIVDFIKASPDAVNWIKQKLGPSANYGLPEYIHGVRVVVEDAAKITSRKGATKVAAYVMDDTKPFICARPGGIEAPAGGPTFSTITIFEKENMTVESMDNANDRLTEARVVDDVAVVLTAPVTGYLFTAAVAA